MYTVTIIYDTRSGNTEKMAKAVAEGIQREGGVKAVIKHVDDASGQDLLNSEGIIIGSPTHCGLMSWKLKRFFDENTKIAWGKVDGRIAAAFSTSGGLGGGNEMTLLSILNALMNYGFMVFGLPEYAAPGVTAHYGAVSVQTPGEHELESCRILGQKMARYVKMINGEKIR
ncbi:NAD(P)H dehydrogenase (quinone) [Caldanaerobius fijiensis DSM 17918]|uniref:NAD(P)H dehydrogenase (Quinone) n=1 Tax=Caldanaerobius fijiensis DSM 17918 TaxID=1121256 RepID=A0A1M5C587_9THEO|nr:flavodoxin domain-containing protein [Caldanaerobius fijiensis]SHF49933.1 NAD(P)H dehydrogenase (quinone) [Caldanaerobius fijiensis DSM 17918]